MRNITTFDPQQHHIHLDFSLTNHEGNRVNVKGILDTGAPRTEFSDRFLINAELIESQGQPPQLKPGLQTQKYGMVVIPSVEICGRKIKDFGVYVSHFDKFWGIDALVGLDFFRLYQVTINYQKGFLITEPFV